MLKKKDDIEALFDKYMITGDMERHFINEYFTLGGMDGVAMKYRALIRKDGRVLNNKKIYKVVVPLYKGVAVQKYLDFLNKTPYGRQDNHDAFECPYDFFRYLERNCQDEIQKRNTVMYEQRKDDLSLQALEQKLSI